VHDRRVVVFSGGGTGGHLYPALAVADELRSLHPDVRTLFIGSRRGIEGRILAERGEWHLLLPVQGLDRSRPARSLLGVAGLVGSIFRTLRLFVDLRPEAVVVTGGYASAPAGIAAVLTGTPLVLQEPNAVPGLVTKLLSRWAARVHVAFPEAVDRLPAGRDRAVVSGNPVRPPSDIERGQARARLDLPEGATVLLVVGGSQGARAVNDVLLEAVRSVVTGGLDRVEGLHVLWATGPAHHEHIRDELEAMGEAAEWVVPVPYIDDMPVALVASDLALARAGATFTAELLVEGLPAVLVPLPSAAEDHQARNAESIAAAGAAVVLPQAELTPDRLWSVVGSLTSDVSRLSAMRRAALEFARPEATRRIAESVARTMTSGTEAA
jgi:UDP-N-acetylglucosamine--N-acetylmuramyl-(pentapeptide) pyrophosphoryl-undecaprenol N-acetylglucosamine transferase